MDWLILANSNLHSYNGFFFQYLFWELDILFIKNFPLHLFLPFT